MTKELCISILAFISSMLVTCFYPDQVKEAVETIVKPFLHMEVSMGNSHRIQTYKEFIDDVMSNDCSSDVPQIPEDFLREPDTFIVYNPDGPVGRLDPRS